MKLALLSYRTIFALMIVAILPLTSGCGSNVTGEVKEKFTGKPIENVKVQATTKTNIAEDKKYENRAAQTNSSGKFTIKGLSSKYNYRIEAVKQGYFTLNEARTSIRPPEKGKTKIIERPLILIKKRNVNGNVIERLNASPIPNAHIIGKSKSRIRDYNQLSLLNVSSNNEGKFEIGPFVPGAKYSVIAEKDGFCGRYNSFMSQGNISSLSRPCYLIKLPDDFGVYLAKEKNNFKYEKLDVLDANFNKIKLEARIGCAGATTYKRYYVAEKEIQPNKNMNSSDADYLVLYFNANVFKKNKLLIVPFKFYDSLPIVYQHRNWKKNKIKYLKQKNIYLYAKSSEDSMPHYWKEINIDSLESELYTSTSSDKRAYLVPLNKIEQGTYVFTLDHGQKWLFTKS